MKLHCLSLGYYLVYKSPSFFSLVISLLKLCWPQQLVVACRFDATF